MSELALRLIEENKKTREIFLDLGNCGLTEVPMELGDLVWLESLSFSSTWWDEKGRHESKNDGPPNRIERLVSVASVLAGLQRLWGKPVQRNPFAGLQRLKTLILMGSFDKRFPLQDISSLAGLANLQFLDVSNTQVADLTPLAGLTNLQTLNATETQVADLAPLAGLANLSSLYMSHTEVASLIPLKKLGSLQYLIARKTKIADLAPLAELANLRILYVSEIKAADLSPLARLANLIHLDVSKTPVTDLVALARLSQMESLSVSDTQVFDLAPLAGLANLQTLNLSGTPVADLAPLSGLANLQRLDVSKTRVADLSPLLHWIERGLPVKWSHQFWKGDGIYVEYCPLTHPPVETVKQGNEAILRYFLEGERVGKIKVREAKLLLVGQGKAGKTTLRKKLENPNAPMPAPDDTTRGIEITRLDEKMPQTGEPLRINIWDFGGQDIQYYAHQFFLTGSSIYALVTNERIQDSGHLSYWLNIVDLLGQKSPVLLIQNKEGGYCKPLEREAAIREQFANVHNRVYQTDFSKAATETEFADLRREIVYQASCLPHVEKEYLASFAQLREKLENLADKPTNYLDWDHYLDLMKELPKELMEDYAKTLTFLGVCQYFPDDPMLANYVFLRPKWIIDALFDLLLHPSIKDAKGHFTEQDTKAIWKGDEYRKMHVLLIRMMKNFELCYRVDGDEETYILPQQLPSESRSYGWDEPGDTSVQYQYKFMPKGILTRLICRLHPRIEKDGEGKQRVWCDAVIFTLPNGKGRVFAREFYSGNIIELRAAGEKRAEMLNEVIRKLDDINKEAKYKNLNVDKLVPCPCPDCLALGEDRYYHKYEALTKRLEKGRSTSPCEKSGDDIDIDEIFGKSGVKRPHLYGQFGREGYNAQPEPLRIFISYSHAEKEFFSIFKTDFERFAKFPGFDIEVFADDGIPIGSDWDTCLREKVADCDVMVLLVSQQFMNSNYIQEKEFGAALERLQTGLRLLIVPVYFAPCSFEQSEALAKFQFFKPDGNAIGDPAKGGEFSYIDLVNDNKADGEGYANRQRYMKALMEKLMPQLKALRGLSAG